MGVRLWRSNYGRGVEIARNPRNLGIAAAVVVLLAIGLWFAFLRQDHPQPTASVTEEPCRTGPAGERVGYLRTVLLCAMDSPSCKPDQAKVFRAQRAGSWSAEAMLIPDIPDGDVITGGDMVDPSPYRLTNMGFNKVSVTNYTNAGDYCTQHYWYYLHANWISDELSDRARIKICVYYDNWKGAEPPATCPAPVANPPQ